MSKEQKELLDKLFNMYPKLKTDETKILKECFGINTIKERTNELVVEAFNYNGQVYYRDKMGGVWSVDSELVGVINGEKCEMFDKVYDYSKDIRKILVSNNNNNNER